MAAGLEQALEFLENVSFTPDEIEYLRRHPVFRHIRSEFFDYLAKFRFTGDVWAMPEGTLVFPGRADAARHRADHRSADPGNLSARDAQLPDHDREQGRAHRHGGSRAAGGGFQRAPRPRRRGEPLSARAAAIGGCAGTSNVLAGQQFGIATYGTQAHSWVMAHEDEGRSVPQVSSTPFPNGAVLLVDTYNVRNAREKNHRSWAESLPACGSIAAIWRQTAAGRAANWIARDGRT